MAVAERIGVYICECGPNIKEAIDVGEALKFAQELDNVVVARVVGLLCAKEGKELVGNDIKEHDLTRVVFAACSPKEHEHTFRKILDAAGLNPFLMQIANIREQCAWVIFDKVVATDKAKAMIAAAVERVVHHEPLEAKEIPCLSDVLVVGAGIAGISAALTLAQQNRKIYLVERSPCIGGKVARYENVFPSLECASCVLDPKLDEVLHNEHIEVLSLSEVQEVLGFYGNFIVRVNSKARYVDTETCIGCGACLEVCPVKVRNEYNEGLDERRAVYIPYAGALPHVAAIDAERCLRFQGADCSACKDVCAFGSIDYGQSDFVRELKVGAIVIATGFDIFDVERAPRYGYAKIEDVYTSLEFERLLSSTGPTEGKILLKNGQPPQKIALVHCVGSRAKKFNEYCSGVCCTYLLKFAHLAKQKLPDVSIVELYSDLCLPGKEPQRFFDKIARQGNIEFVHMRNPGSIRIIREDGKIFVQYVDVHGRSSMTSPDMVVLAPAIEGTKGAGDVAEIFGVSLGEGGFFVEEHTEIGPVSTATEGVFIAGCAQGPKDIQGSVSQGQAAAGMILSRLIPGQKLALEAVTAEVEEDLCSGCKICLGMCHYKAIASDDDGKRVSVNELLCRGCGVCAAACPSGAIKAKHYTDEQMSAEIKGLVRAL